MIRAHYKREEILENLNELLEGCDDSKTLVLKDLEIYHVAIDGPVASGKGTVAKGLSEKLGIPCLDTGAMYRAFAVFFKENSFDINIESDVIDALNEFSLETSVKDDKTFVSVNGVDVTDKIRAEDISMLSSSLSTFPIVREKMVELQREIAKRQSFILEGRDISSVVLPDAKFKFYLTADLKTRAERRVKDVISRGENITLKEMMNQIEQRDKQDKEKPIGALVCVQGAVVIDNTKLSREQTVDAMLHKIRN